MVYLDGFTFHAVRRMTARDAVLLRGRVTLPIGLT
jgi:hypothetical protein